MCITIPLDAINHAAEAWGLRCLRYEIRDIQLPTKVKEAMQMQVRVTASSTGAIEWGYCGNVYTYRWRLRGRREPTFLSLKVCSIWRCLETLVQAGYSIYTLPGDTGAGRVQYALPGDTGAGRVQYTLPGDTGAGRVQYTLYSAH